MLIEPPFAQAASAEETTTMMSSLAVVAVALTTDEAFLYVFDARNVLRIHPLTEVEMLSSVAVDGGRDMCIARAGNSAADSDERIFWVAADSMSIISMMHSAKATTGTKIIMKESSSQKGGGINHIAPYFYYQQQAAEGLVVVFSKSAANAARVWRFWPATQA